MILGRHCLCCKNCTECQEFKKVISETGFEVYVYIQDGGWFNRNYDLLEHQGFIFQNTQDDTINSNEFLRKIESRDFTCQRCRAILKRLANVFKNMFIKKHEIIVICDCYMRNKISEVEPCKYCHNIYDKFNLNKSLQDCLTKEYTGKWIARIRQILDEKRGFRSRDDVQEVTKEESITPIKTRVSKEEFKFVFPETKTDLHDLKEYASSNELCKDIQQKMMLKKTQQQEVSSGERKGKESKHLSVRVNLDDDKEVMDVSSSTGGRKAKVQRGKLNKEIKKGKDDESSDSSSIKSAPLNKQSKLPTKSSSPKSIDKAEKAKHKPDKEITSGRLAGNDKERGKKDRLPGKKEPKSELKYAEGKPEKVKTVKESGDGLMKAMKKKSKDSPKNKDQKQSPHSKPQKDDKASTAMKDAKERISAPKQSKVQKESEKEKRSKSAYTDKVNAKIRKGSADFAKGLITFKDSIQKEKARKLTQSELYTLPPLIKRQRPPKIERTPSSGQKGSDLDTDIEECLKKSKLHVVNEIIIGQKILKQKLHDKIDHRQEIRPLLFESTFYAGDIEVKQESMDKITSFALCTEGRRKRKSVSHNNVSNNNLS